MKTRTTFCVVLAALVGVAGVGGAYEAVEVTDGGTLAGTVEYQGRAPVPARIEVTKDTKVCGTEKTSPDLLVGPDGGLENAVVVVQASRGKAMPPPSTVEFDQKGCEYHPHILAFPAGSTVTVLNSDGVLHNVHVESTVNPEANRAMPGFEKRIEWKVDKPEWPIPVTCDVHPWMHAYWLSMDEPYYAVTDEHGRFSIGDIPPGDYEVEIWHETLGKKTEKVHIPAGGTVTVDWSLGKP
jgi:plastocyanin